MTTPAAISWIGLLTLMVDGPDLPVRGVISSREGEDGSHRYYGLASLGAGPMPVLAGFVSETPEDGPVGDPRSDPFEDFGHAVEEEPVLTRVWRSGRRVRLERPDGRPSLIVDDEWCWQFRGEDPVPVVSPSSAVAYQGNGTQLLHRRDANDFTGDDFTRPTGPVGTTTFLGRPSYTVELAPPAHKPYPIQLVVDCQTGLVLQQRNDGFAAVDEWVELEIGEPLDEQLFRWQGPSRSQADERADREREWRADLAARADWFRAQVTPQPLRVELELGVLVHDHQLDGSFEASLGESGMGMLARRPRSDEDWQLGWLDVQHRWTAGGWDWALSWQDEKLTETGLAALKRALGAT